MKRALNYTSVRLVAAGAALIAAAACSKPSQPMDSGLQKDLAAAGGGAFQLAAPNAPSQTVVSAIEGGPTSAPQHAAPKRINRPTPRPAQHLASNRNRVVEAPAPAPQPQHVEVAPQPEPRAEQPAPVPQPVQPAPTPAPQQHGVYKSEGEIFRQMPWIRP